MRRPSMRSTEMDPPSISTTSPTWAMRPRRAMMKPPMVSYAPSSGTSSASGGRTVRMVRQMPHDVAQIVTEAPVQVFP